MSITKIASELASKAKPPLVDHNEEVKRVVAKKLSSINVPFKIKSITEDTKNTYNDGIDYQVRVVFNPDSSREYSVIWKKFIAPYISDNDGHFLFKMNKINGKIVDITTIIRIR